MPMPRGGAARPTTAPAILTAPARRARRFLLATLVLPLAGLLAGCDGSDDRAGGEPGALPPDLRYVADDPACPAPRCFEVEVPLPDGVFVPDTRVRVIVPQDYATSGRRYPVLYLLHDAPGSYRSWTQLGDAEAQTRDLPVIVVMPDAGGGAATSEAGWYSDWVDGSRQWESYHVDVMIPWLERHLAVLGDGHRAAAGSSMGGFGAMSYSARHPGLFAAAAGVSGAVDFLHLEQASALYVYLGHPLAGTPNDPIWGDPVTNYDEWQAHDPGSNIDGLAGMQIFLACGNGLPGGPHDDPAQLPLYATETLIQLMNSSFAQSLADAGVAHETWFYGPGYHDWPYYRDTLAWALPRLMGAIDG